MWANISVLNRLRMSVPRRGYREFSFRPHAGEAGLVDHLAGAFLLSDGLNHGIVAKSSPSMQMLLYLSQIGVAMSPMSNNSLFVHYNDNPFDTFFRRGLNLSLSTDDPLQFHYTTQPLIEEYGVASTVWHYSSADMCEIARNSVLQSGFEDGLKSHWLGPKFAHGASGNDMNKSNVPDERLRFREKNLTEERHFFFRCKKMYNDAKASRRAFAPQGHAPQTPQLRSASPINDGTGAPAITSFGSLARYKSASSHHASSGKSSPSRISSSPKKFDFPHCPSTPIFILSCACCVFSWPLQELFPEYRFVGFCSLLFHRYMRLSMQQQRHNQTATSIGYPDLFGTVTIVFIIASSSSTFHQTLLCTHSLHSL